SHVGWRVGRDGCGSSRRPSVDRSEKGQQKLRQAYNQLLQATSRVVGQAKKFSREIVHKIKRGSRAVLRRCQQQLEVMIPRVQQLMRQARQRVFGGDTRVEGKSVSIFEPQTEVIRKGKAGKLTEF